MTATNIAALRRVNDGLNRSGLMITRVVGTMWTAALFAGITLVSLPAAIESHSAIVIVQWVASVFLQLVLLPIIIVGQNQQTQRHNEHAAKLDAIHTAVKNQGRP